MSDFPETEYPRLLRLLSDYSESGAAPMHMPGHKRNVTGIAFLEALGAKFDITEISGFDDLHAPHGILLEAEERAARIWGSDRTFFLVNGSTVGVLAAVRACAALSGTGRLIMARNCHRAVYNACELCGLSPVFLAPQAVDGFSFYGGVSPSDVERAVRESPGTPVLITSPTYEGVLSNVAEIAIVCHMYGSPLIVDEAHGAHLGLSPYFTGGAVSAGADVTVQSLHKTMTGLTQTGLLHVNGGLVPPEAVARELTVFETSSPSYLLMASIDGTAELVEKEGKTLFRDWDRRLTDFDEAVSGLDRLKCPGHGVLFDCQQISRAGYSRRRIEAAGVYGFDRSKLLISCEGTDVTGVRLAAALRERYGIECEMAAGAYVVAMTGLLDSDENLRRLSDALLELDRGVQLTAPRIAAAPPPLPPRKMSASQALRAAKRERFFRDAVGKVSAEYVWAYPPGCPCIIPGEVFTPEIVSALTLAVKNGLNLGSSSGGVPRTLLTAESG